MIIAPAPLAPRKAHGLPSPDSSRCRRTRPDRNAWRSIHQGADIRIPGIYKFIMTFVTPLYLLIIMSWWGVTRALPTLRLEGVDPESAVYLHISRLIMVGIAVFFLVMVRIAWKRNGYDDRVGFREVEDTLLGEPVYQEEVVR